MVRVRVRTRNRARDRVRARARVGAWFRIRFNSKECTRDIFFLM